MQGYFAPVMAGEYNAIVPIMNVGKIHGSAAFLGYRAFLGESKGPAAINNPGRERERERERPSTQKNDKNRAFFILKDVIGL
jgi:hypothetical protein